MFETQAPTLFAQVIIPVVIGKPFTYAVPEELMDLVEFGLRVEVQFGKKKIYAGLIVGLTRVAPAYEVKPIMSVLDVAPLISEWQYKMWDWMAGYYCCSIGEIMNAALPAHFKLSSETIFVFGDIAEDQLEDLDDDEYLIYQSLRSKPKVYAKDIEKILGRKSIQRIVLTLFRKGILMVEEDIKDKYSPKVVYLVAFSAYFQRAENQAEAFDLVAKSEHQTNALLAFMSLIKTGEKVSRKKLLAKASVTHGVIKALENKGIFEIKGVAVNRFDPKIEEVDTSPIRLSNAQSIALSQVQKSIEARPTLLYGVTGSGKTMLYVHLIEDAIARGEQVLYLLPEIALSIQIIKKLRLRFGSQVVVSHSRLNNNERVDLWKKVADGAPVIIGVRSSIFLPFKNLGLIIVDEEHDPSFKQFDPSPRYQARDMAIYLSYLLKAKILLGTATPSFETWYNVRQEKYGVVKLMERYQAVEMPEIELIDLRYESNKDEKQVSNLMRTAMEQTLEQDEQVIIFKNRRGYAPILRCTKCEWKAECPNCAVSLTFHKFKNGLQCHLCGYRTYLPNLCPACNHEELLLEGFGTQKIEDELDVLFPNKKVGRMDFDTTRKKESHEKIISAFEDRELDILVGTQMVTKGLDFDHVGLVGVVQGDQQLTFPDFRALERMYQMLVQVAGRAGRKHKQGRVFIQTFYPDHAIFADIKQADFESFFSREIIEREKFNFPPFYRLIKVTVKHPKQDVARFAMHELHKVIIGKLDKRVLGPSEPTVNKVRGKYLFDLLIKMEKQPALMRQIKSFLISSIQHVKKMKGLSGIQVRLDVDP